MDPGSTCSLPWSSVPDLPGSPPPGNSDFPVDSETLMESLPSLHQEACCCLLSGCSSFGCERPLLLPASSRCWAQWLSPHLIKGDLYVQAEILIGKAAPLLEMPLEYKGFLQLKKKVEPSPHRTPAPRTCAGAHTVLLGMLLGCVCDAESFLLGVPSI